MDRWALLSPCSRYRWVLGRSWDRRAPVLGVVGLNPSTADGRDDDPTLRRLIGFARSWGFGSLRLANLYALRTPHPRVLFADDAPVGPSNDAWIAHVLSQSDLCLAAWGNGGVGPRADAWTKAAPWHVLGTTRLGAPRHPLYVRADAKPVPWRPA